MTDLNDPLAKAQRRGDFSKRLYENSEADQKRADQARTRAEQRVAALEKVIDRIGQMAQAWEQQLPDTIRTAAAVEAIRIVLERADTAPPLDHVQILDQAIARLQSIPVQCTALTGPVWYGEGWKDAIRELEEYADYARPDPAHVTEPQES